MNALMVIPTFILVGGVAGFAIEWKRSRSIFDAGGFGFPFGALCGLFLSAVVLTTIDALR